MPANEKVHQRDRYIGVRIPKALYAEAKKQAKASRQGFSAWVRLALADAAKGKKG